MKNIALIDNHDSFTYNIKHLIEQTGSGVDVFDSLSLDINLLDNYQKLIIGPAFRLSKHYFFIRKVCPNEINSWYLFGTSSYCAIFWSTII